MSAFTSFFAYWLWLQLMAGTPPTVGPTVAPAPVATVAAHQDRAL